MISEKGVLGHKTDQPANAPFSGTGCPDFFFASETFSLII